MRGGLRSASFTWKYEGTVWKSGLLLGQLCLNGSMKGPFGKAVFYEGWS